MNPNMIRRKTLELAVEHGNGHIASAFSIVEILVALYDNVLTKDDKFILSKGHGCLSFYVVLREKGFNPTISGHPDIDVKNGIECTTGSLGHGLPVAVGMALAKKLKKEKGTIYVLLGDGESQEGTTWESLAIASHHKLGNLVVIVDKNNLQALGETRSILSLNSLREKVISFGCHSIRCNGHDVEKIGSALRDKCSSHNSLFVDFPKVVIADTVKGKGVSFMENRAEWHHRIPDERQLKLAYGELA